MLFYTAAVVDLHSELEIDFFKEKKKFEFTVSRKCLESFILLSLNSLECSDFYWHHQKHRDYRHPGSISLNFHTSVHLDCNSGFDSI